jgi:hypothetical protein
MSNRERGALQRGTSVLAALVFVAVLSAVAYAVHSIVPSNPIAQTATAKLAFVEQGDTSFTAAVKTDAVITGVPRCIEELEKKKNPTKNTSEDKAAAKKNVCVPGCRYEIQVKGLFAVIDGRDLCAEQKLEGRDLENCKANTKCSVLTCEINANGRKECKAAQNRLSTPLQGSELDDALEKAAYIPDAFKKDPRIQSALELSRTDRATAEQQVSQMDWYLQDAYKQARTDDLRIQESALLGERNSVKSDLDSVLKQIDEQQAQIARNERDGNPGINTRLQIEQESLMAKRDELNAKLAKVNADLSHTTGSIQVSEGKILDGPPASGIYSSDLNAPKAVSGSSFNTAYKSGREEDEEFAKADKRQTSVYAMGGVEPPPGSSVHPSCKTGKTGAVCVGVPQTIKEQEFYEEQKYQCESDGRDVTCTRAVFQRPGPQITAGGKGGSPNTEPPPGTIPGGGERQTPGADRTTTTKPAPDTTRTTTTRAPAADRAGTDWSAILGKGLAGLAQGFTLGYVQAQRSAAQQQSPYAQSPYGPYGYPQQQQPAAPQCPPPPTQPVTACANGGSWQPQTTMLPSGQQCVIGWMCSTANVLAPTAELTCAPLVGDAGSAISISYSCGNSTTSTGVNFSSDGALSGSVSAILPQSASANYGITCGNALNQTATKSCTVQIAKPTIVLVANPQSVVVGTQSTIGWVTSGMQSCIVSSPQSAAFTAANADNTATTGSAKTPAITAPMTITLTCQTAGGGTKIATQSIVIKGSD